MSRHLILDEKAIQNLEDEVGAENIPMLFNIFLGELQQYTVRLNVNPNTSAWVIDCGEICHSLKSNAASFGAAKLCTLAKELDLGFKNDAIQVDDYRIADLADLIELTTEEYRQFLINI